jgi:hypothetical protein
VNRANRRSIAGTSIVVHVQRALAPEKVDKVPEPASKKDGKLPEWASFTAIIAGITFFAFAASSFFVYAFADHLDIPLAIYFSPTDYLKITPAWAIPTLGSGALVLMGIGGVVVLILRAFNVAFDKMHNWRAIFDFFPNLVKDSKTAVWVLIGVFLFLGLVLPNLPLFHGSLYWRVITHSPATTFLAFAAISFLPWNAAIKGMFVAIVWCLAFASWTGSLLKPDELRFGPIARIYFEPEKDKVTTVIGNIFFDLERYLLLLTPTGTVIAIPHEQIKLIETTPPHIAPWFAWPTPPWPTPAQPSPKLTETPRVLPSPVGSPTATAEPQRNQGG